MNTGHYRFRFYLNAKHFVSFHNIDSKTHPHTWEFILHVKKGAEVFEQFSEIEGNIQQFLSVYESKCLNDIVPFDSVMPTMENIGDVFAEMLARRLAASGWRVLMLEISENPARTYVVTPEADTAVIPVRVNTDDQMGVGRLECNEHQQEEVTLTVMEHLQETGVQSADSGQKATAVPLVEDQQQVKDCLPDTDHQQDTGTLPDSNNRKDTGSLYDSDNQADTQNPEQTTMRTSDLLYLLVSTAGALAAGIALYLWITREGTYPWSSDSWYHLFKGHILYQSIQEGNWFPLYSDIWYNGIQPFRYWAPLPHYLLALCEFVTGGNTSLSYNFFIVFVFTAGAAGWLMWGVHTGRRGLAAVLALLWFCLPDNLRVLFSEGNLSRVAVSTIFPFLLLSVTIYMEKRKTRSLAAVAAYMLAITFCHAMIAAMVGITVALFALLQGFADGKIREGLKVTAAAACGIACAGIWLVPALTGGLLSMDSEAVKVLAGGLTYPALDSLNPLLRLKDPNVFYFGSSIFAAAFFGLFFSTKKGRAAFTVVLIIFIGTTKALLPIILKLPLSQAFWMMRFTPLAMAVFFAAVLFWKGLKKEILAAMLVLVMVDCGISFHVLAHDSIIPAASVEVLKSASEGTDNRLALFDDSRMGSFPSFYLSFGNSGKVTRQVFGSGWQGAATSENIMLLNTALEKHWYDYLFDRCLEYGADTITILKSMKCGRDSLMTAARRAGYHLDTENASSYTFKYPIKGKFGTVPHYTGLGIGKYAYNLSLAFPAVEMGSSTCIDDYSLEELAEYKVIYLSGFTYRNRKNAEKLVTELSTRGVKVMVDLTNAKQELFTSRADFLGVLAETAVFRNKLPEIKAGQKTIAFSKKLPEEYAEWRSVYLENLDSVSAGTYFENQRMDIIGTKLNRNIVFIGLNLPYYAMITGDSTALGLLEQATGLKAGALPDRKTIPIRMTVKSNTITLHSDIPGVITGIADIGTFQALRGSFGVKHHLICMKGRDLVLKACYPEPGKGIAVSAAGILTLGFLLFRSQQKKKNFILSQNLEKNLETIEKILRA